jgi:hypothetical protein
MNLLTKLRQNVFAVSIIVLTVILLVVFKYQQSQEKSKENFDFFSQFYSETIKPIFTSKTFDKKDVVNFAVNGNLLLDKGENKVLQLKSDLSGKEIISIKKDGAFNTADNYQNFVKGFDLDSKQKVEFDSILDNYSKILAQSIYKDDNDFFAVDPNIGKIKASLNKDLSNFIQNIKNESGSQNYVFSNLLKENQNKSTTNYFVFTSDTVLLRQYKNIDEMNKNLAINKKMLSLQNIDHFDGELTKLDEQDFSVYIDSNLINITLNGVSNMGNISNDKNFKKNDKGVSFSLKISDEEKDKPFINFSYSDGETDAEMEMNSNNVEGAVSNSLKMYSGKNLDEWIEFGIKMDSISKNIEKKKNAANKKTKGDF